MRALFSIDARWGTTLEKWRAGSSAPTPNAIALKLYTTTRLQSLNRFLLRSLPLCRHTSENKNRKEILRTDTLH